MNIDDFTRQFGHLKDVNLVTTTCDHPEHSPKGEVFELKKVDLFGENCNEKMIRDFVQTLG